MSYEMKRSMFFINSYLSFFIECLHIDICQLFHTHKNHIECALGTDLD